MSLFKIVQITEANVRTEMVSGLSWSAAFLAALQLCVKDRDCRYEILDQNDHIVFESYAKTDRGTRGFYLHRQARSRSVIN